ncbi:hypothetical protein [Candidatus Thiosymbion oneisti]|nr:hypothetical protein [Candidatus Thiosymbion oneisti]
MVEKHGVDFVDEYPRVTEEDMERAVFRIGLKPAPKRQLVLIDTGLVEYFKAKSGQQDYQELIDNVLRWAIKHDVR